MRVLTAAAILASTEALSQGFAFNAPGSGYGYGYPGWNQQQFGWNQFGWGSTTPSPWVNSPSSQWTYPSSASSSSSSSSSYPSQALAGRSPSEQLQITKCRTGQTCEKCRQLNCYWDATASITNRCIALGLESTQIPVDQGVASNLGQCPALGQTGSMGVNWLAIEASGAQVPRLDGMSDADVYRWISGLPNYQPDSADVNYPAGTAFRDLLPNAAQQYQSGKIPSTTPWVSFWDSLNGYNGLNGYGYDDSYPGYGYTGYPGSNPGSYPGGYPGAFPGAFSNGYPGAYPSYPGAFPNSFGNPSYPIVGGASLPFAGAGVPTGYPPATVPPAGLSVGDLSGFPLPASTLPPIATGPLPPIATTSPLSPIPSYPSQPIAG